MTIYSVTSFFAVLIMILRLDCTWMCTLLILKCQTSNPAPIFSVCVKLCVRIGLSVGPVIQKGERYQGAWKGGGGKGARVTCTHNKHFKHYSRVKQLLGLVLPRCCCFCLCWCCFCCCCCCLMLLRLLLLFVFGEIYGFQRIMVHVGNERFVFAFACHRSHAAESSLAQTHSHIPKHSPLYQHFTLAVITRDPLTVH